MAPLMWPVASETMQLLSVLIGFESCLLTFLQNTSKCISSFHARKLCHAGTGLVLLQLDSQIVEARFFVYLVGLGALAVTWNMVPFMKPFRWARLHDEGMTAYCIVAMLWFWMQLPIAVLAPMFFADPAGAVVGKGLSGMKDRGVPNPVWWRANGTQKTVGGSLAVLLVTAVAFVAPATLPQRLLVGVVAALAEAMGGAYDNVLLVLVVVGARVLLNMAEFGTGSLRPPVDVEIISGEAAALPVALAFLGQY